MIQVLMTFRGMKPSPTIEAYVNGNIKKLERVLKNERPPQKLEVVLEAQHTHVIHAIDVRLQSSTYHLMAKSEGKDLYALIDEVFDELLKKFKSAKGKRLVKRKSISVAESSMAPETASFDDE
jgi:ribosomal subunit interface protein